MHPPQIRNLRWPIVLPEKGCLLNSTLIFPTGADDDVTVSAARGADTMSSGEVFKARGTPCLKLVLTPIFDNLQTEAVFDQCPRAWITPIHAVIIVSCTGEGARTSISL